MNTVTPVCLSWGIFSYSSATLNRSPWGVPICLNNACLYILFCVYVLCKSLCLCGGSRLFPGSLTIWIISASSAFSLWTPGEVAALGHSRTRALQEPHSQLYPGLHCGCGGLRHHKSVSLKKSAQSAHSVMPLNSLVSYYILLPTWVDRVNLSLTGIILWGKTKTSQITILKQSDRWSPLRKEISAEISQISNIIWMFPRLHPLSNETRCITLTSHPTKLSLETVTMTEGEYR